MVEGKSIDDNDHAVQQASNMTGMFAGCKKTIEAADLTPRLSISIPVDPV
jgi:hypothetical protein